ncbi:MAG: ATP-dependent DNA helicase [Thermoplasmata archaeon]|nr:ATP-dependent DNA helicase [Thermoplasmata archaeon]
MTVEIFPYTPRPNQKIILEQIQDILSKKGHIIIESGTGSGKTICGLAPCIEYGLINNKKIIYLTRTNSQQDQVFKELRELQKHCEIFGIGMQGRQNLCTLFDSDKHLKKGTSEELSKLCGDKKKAVIEGDRKKGCRYYENLLNHDLDELRMFAKTSVPTLGEFKEHCNRKDICPYEASKILMSDANVVSAPYIFFFSPVIRRTFLNWMNAVEEDVIVVIDEAHNLPDFARELISMEMSGGALDLALSEAYKIGDPLLVDGVNISDLLGMLKGALDEIAEEYVIDEDGLVPPKELETQIMSKFRITDIEMKNMILDLLTHGNIIREKKRMLGKLPRSFIHSIAVFMLNWVSQDDSDSTKLVNGGDNPFLETYGLDPSKITGILNKCHSSIHLSGTLSPLDEYRDSIGLDKNTPLLSLPSPFPPENRKLLFVEDVTTKYEVFNTSDEIREAIKEYIGDVVREYDRNTIIFFPSYSMLSSFRSVLDTHGRPFYHESGKMTQKELMDMVSNFKKEGNGVLLAVMGGRISEGIDFPGDALEIVVLVGIPFPKPTAKHKSLFEYYDRKHGRGWEYTVVAPATRKLLQSMGRLIRTETDRGVALVLDRRVKQFKNYLPGLAITENPVLDIDAFFNRGTP